jgi:hypothetical protein
MERSEFREPMPARAAARGSAATRTTVAMEASTNDRRELEAFSA